MRFSERAFLAGGEEQQQMERDTQSRARQSLDAAYQADDTPGIENARRILEGKGGLMSKLFRPDEPDRGSGIVDPFSGQSMNKQSGPDAYDQVRRGFQDELTRAGNNNSLIRKAFNKFQTVTGEQDRYFKNDRGRNLNVKDYLKYGKGKGGGGKPKYFYYGGKLVQMSSRDMKNKDNMKSALADRYGIKWNQDTNFKPAGKGQGKDSRDTKYDAVTNQYEKDIRDLPGQIDDYGFFDKINPLGENKEDMQARLARSTSNLKGRRVEYLDNYKDTQGTENIANLPSQDEGKYPPKTSTAKLPKNYKIDLNKKQNVKFGKYFKKDPIER